MPKESQADHRFHSLDALRAWAMLLGIVLHTVWFMSKQYYGTPITDADGNYFYVYILAFIHMFRLQAFFVMAGFFANLVFTRRGHWRFIWHRLSRIGVPLLVGWMLLYPLTILQFTWGGMISGRVLSDNGLWATCRSEIATSFKLNPSDFIHLWFLYDLLAIYALTLIGLFVIRKVLDRRGILRRHIGRLFRSLIQSPWSVLVLAFPSAFLLYCSSWWWGIDAYPIWFRIPWHSLLGYWLFFTVGWLLYTHWDLLQDLGANWRRNLTWGVCVSVPLFLVSVYADFRATPLYPLLEANHIGGVAPLLTAGAEQAAGVPRTPQQRVWQLLSPTYQKFLSANPDPTSDQKAGLAVELNKRIVLNPDFYEPSFWQAAGLPVSVTAMSPDNSVPDEAARAGEFNRRLLEAAFPGMIATDFMTQPSAKWLKAGFSAGYGLVMWLLVFGFIGLFHSQFDGPSPLKRYLADAAYWIYIIHLPILFQIELFVADSRWGLGGVPKFLFYNVVATILCFASYHYLVRSTLIGRVLNGRRYPFVPWFGVSRSKNSPAVSTGPLAPKTRWTPAESSPPTVTADFAAANALEPGGET